MLFVERYRQNTQNCIEKRMTSNTRHTYQTYQTHQNIYELTNKKDACEDYVVTSDLQLSAHN